MLGQFESRNVTFVDPDGSWPIVWERAKGVHVWDPEGKKYLDLTAAFGVAAHAEVNEVRMSKQFGLPYLPMIVIEAQQLIEKNAKAAGLGDVKTSWTQRVGPAAELDALLAGQADFIGPGATTLATIWEKTVGTPQEVRALIAMQSMPFVLVTRNPDVKTIADFTDKDKIALPAVKVSIQAVVLEMAAAKAFGEAQFDKAMNDVGNRASLQRGARNFMNYCSGCHTATNTPRPLAVKILMR